MRYKTVKDVIEFLKELNAEEVDELALGIKFTFYFDGKIVGFVSRDMYSTNISTSRLINVIYNYRVERVVVNERGCMIYFNFMLL